MTGHHPSLGTAFDPLHIQVEPPHAFFARLRQEEPITFSPTVNAYLVSRYDDIQSILAQPDTFSSKDVLGSPAELHPGTIAELRKGHPFAAPLLSDDGARHTRMRQPFQNAFSPPRIRAMEPLVREIVNRLIDRFISDGQVEFISQFAYLLPLEVILTLFGIPQQDLAMVKERSDAVLRLIVLPLSPEEQLECARQFVALEYYYAHLIEERRKHPGVDLISELIRDGMAKEDPLSDIDLMNLIIGVVIAGHETTTRLLGNGLVLLLEDSIRWQILREHPEDIPLVIEEILRFRGPVLGFIRTTTRETTVGGITMPEGTKLLLLYASGNLDESHFPHACDFEMQRRPNHHLAFGYGIHFCIGAPLARLEGRVTFETLTQRVPGMRLVPDQRFEYNFRFSNYGYKRVYVQWN